MGELIGGTGHLPAAAALIGAALALAAVTFAGVWILRRQPHSARSESIDETVRRHIEAENYKEAAELRLRQGQIQSALALFQNAGDLAKVAQCYLRLKKPVQAGEAYRELGRLAEAAHYFEAAGQWADAADCLHRLGCNREAAELYERADQLDSAAEILNSIGDAESAARLYARASMGGEAAEALLEARGRTPAVLRRAAELFQAAGAIERAAECWTDAGELRRAAELFEEAEEYERAADVYARDNAWSLAAVAYEKAGSLEKARDSYTRGGNRMRAARVDLSLGHHLEAARSFYELGSYERAIEVLQAIPEDSEEHRPACYLLGRVFNEKGLFERARDTLSAVRPATPSSKEDLQLLELLADSLERSGDSMGALDLLEEIAEAEEGFGGVAARIERLQERVWGASTESASAYHTERYDLREEVGRGGMGIVYRAWDKELERPVAIKFLPGQFASDAAALKMFRQEARSAASMNHPNIVHIYDVAVIAAQPCIVMEYVQGRTVRELMRLPDSRDKQPLRAVRVAEIAREICHALSFAHTQNVVHRDIKPSNMLIAADGRAKLMDFGISRAVEAGGEGVNQAKGTPQYMPPEQILGHELDGRADLYALGISMFEMSTGQRPFGGESVVDQQLHLKLPDPLSYAPDLPEVLVEVIRKACEKDPANRYDSANDMAEVLSSFIDNVSLQPDS
jgi:tetratricopeptide (TPR) repeat protein